MKKRSKQRKSPDKAEATREAEARRPKDLPTGERKGDQVKGGGFRVYG